MLKLSVKNCDMVRISKILAKNNVNASVESTHITIEGPLTEEIARLLCESIEINAISNLESTRSQIRARQLLQDDDTCSKDTSPKEQTEVPHKFHELKYSTVKRGEVYLCDFGEPYEKELGYIRYAIVVQNNAGNNYSSTTIVIPCTTAHEAKIPTQLSFYYKDVMKDYDEKVVGNKNNTILAEQIRTVSKSRLLKFLGTLTEEFMQDKVQPLIEISLALKPRLKTIIKPEVHTVVKEVCVPQPKARITGLNEKMKELLEFVNTDELVSISKAEMGDEEKVLKILELFGFNMKAKGMEYVIQAIMVSPKEDYFNLSTLSQKICESSQDSQFEVERLVVARIKENFRMKKSPTIDFIRLINMILWEDNSNVSI